MMFTVARAAQRGREREIIIRKTRRKNSRQPLPFFSLLKTQQAHGAKPSKKGDGEAMLAAGEAGKGKGAKVRRRVSFLSL